MVYDCFMFFNELTILEIRLETLWNIVDKFVIVESEQTHSGLDKPFYFEENKNKFEKYLDKIIYIKLYSKDNIKDDRPKSFEAYHRNYIMQGLTNCNDEDIVLISDVDEIPKPDCIQYIINENILSKYYMVNMIHRLYYYKFNLEMEGCELQWKNLAHFSTKAILFKDLKNTMPNLVRIFGADSLIIPDAGWHFSFIGNTDNIITKLKSFLYQEYNIPKYLDKKIIEEKIKNGDDLFDRGLKYKKVSVEKMPYYIQINQDKFKEFLV